MSAEQREGPRWSVIAPVAVVVALLAGGAAILTRSDDDPAVTPAPAATEPVDAPTTTPPSEPATVAPEPTAPATTPAPADPTEQDVTAFVDANGPAEHSATGDVDGDGIDEVVLARVRNDTTNIVVGSWDGAQYRTSFEDDGGSADRVDGLDLQDYNDEPGVEIVTLESVGEAGASLSIWGWDGAEIARQVAEGGCWDGFHHYGISGATVEPGEIVATCDGSPLPPEGWTSDVYAWTDGAWTYSRSEEPGG